MDDKIRLLFLAANPVDTGRIRLDEEAREISQKLATGKHRNSFELIANLSTRPNDLQHALLEHRPHIVHFSGHGKGSQGLLLQDEGGKSKLVTLKAISDLFRTLKNNIRIVFFNGCYSRPQAEAFSAVIDYTVGTTSYISDRASIVFAGSFYQALAFGLSVRDGFELAKNELALRTIRNTGSPKLFIHEGVDPSTPFVTQIIDTTHKEETAPAPSLDRVKTTVERLSEEGATSTDALTIQQAVVAGSIVLEQIEQQPSAGSKKERKKSGRHGSSKKESVPPERELTRIGTMVDWRAAKPGRQRKAGDSKQKTRDSQKKIGQVGTDDDLRIGTRVESESTAAPKNLHDNSLDLELGVKEYERVQEKLFPTPPGLPPPLPSLIFVGREQALSDVKELLELNEQSSERRMVVIRGWPGVGKTAFVSILARDPQVLEAFPDGVLWTSLGRHPEVIQRMAEWGRALGTSDLIQAATVEQASLRLKALLHQRRMLLMVDDVWQAQDAIPFLRAIGNRCAFVLTTRLPVVAEALSSDPSKIYVLPVLTEADAIGLLRYFSPSSVEEYPAECRALVQELGYLPLALHVAGRLLRIEEQTGLSVVELIEGIREDARILENSVPLDRAMGTVFPALRALFKTSTDELDELTRDCFAFLGVFAPKPATFDTSALEAIWQVDDPKPIIRKLVGHGLMEPTGSGRFQVHPLLIEHARSLLNQ